ncbi:spore photoproduct lyase [Dulcicalothrix desertica PCC 7102]|uniref:Spore photoproduct lyase n=1 Tax=Dulcicalothrix desertica PCC 7102 TaxID=232991 RepID=A0A433VQK7_9CYAN|nr:radical SAM protein [Dulcicalothrix desertica]RUT08302.1 spore photoproduct lyase [Dulcicalothrix desertica PCC 7102]TWH40169.1 spore photoproduct lyase [Dulcicalothrix desertica PCC 7102]
MMLADKVSTDSTELRPVKLWMPERVVFTPAALDEPWGQKIKQRIEALNLPIEELPRNRLTGLRGETERETYDISKRTLAVVTAPPSQFKLSPIPPSADWQFHLAEGCPAHCQYCYLAGSLSGPPVIRAYANLPQILDNLAKYEQPGKATSYEVSCYTDPLGIEHLTGSLAECIRYFGTREDGYLRWVSKFDAVEPLLDLPHNGHTRCRVSVNAAPISGKFEGGTASVASRLMGLRKLALAKYPVGLVVAPIMPMEDWEIHYSNLFDQISNALDFECDLTFELISHRFTPGSKEVLQSWYPHSKLDMDEEKRSVKRNKFGGTKYVYDNDIMKTLRRFFEGEIGRRFPNAKILYWT